MNSKLTADRAMQAQLDRLASGELPDNDRRSLLAWLDEDASRWRACAVAFLEAQSWEAAAASWPEPAGKPAAVRRSAPTFPASQAAPRGRGVWRQVLGLAAAGILLFAAGHLSGRIASPPADVKPGVAHDSAPQADQSPLLASAKVRTRLDPHIAAHLQIPVTRVAAEGPPARAVSDYERKQWEKRGFELHEELRYLPARLPNGSEILVPINKIHVRLKGTPMS
jgi:hypothetical protein